MSLAQSKVFSLPEIVENILLQLPNQDLLVDASLVCRTWHTSIIKSSALQQKLFFQPISSNMDQTPRFNPLLQKAFKLWFRQKSEKESYIRHPFDSLDWNRNPTTRAAYSSKEASWRQMLPVQPPATKFEVNAVKYYQSGTTYEKGEVQFPEGVRMGTLYDYAQETVARLISSFSMEWNMFPRADLDDDTPSKEEVAWKATSTVTMHTWYTFQCSIDMPSDVGPEFVSEGYQELDVVLKQVPRPVGQSYETDLFS